MAKYFGFIGGSGHASYMCDSDAEKNACVANDTAFGRGVVYVQVSDATFTKGHDCIADFKLNVGGTTEDDFTWDVDNDATLETSKQDAINELAFASKRIGDWLNSQWSSDATIKAGWQSYKDELDAIDVETKSWPTTGTHPLAGLVGDGITSFRNLHRLI